MITYKTARSNLPIYNPNPDPFQRVASDKYVLTALNHGQSTSYDEMLLWHDEVNVILYLEYDIWAIILTLGGCNHGSLYKKNTYLNKWNKQTVVMHLLTLSYTHMSDLHDGKYGYLEPRQKLGTWRKD